MLGTLSVDRLGLPLFTLALGLLDGFNPCAMWVLLFLYLLVHLHDRKRMAMVAATFVVVSGAVYYAFMAAWLNVFLLVGITAPLRWGMGAVALLIGGVNINEVLRPGAGYSLYWPWSSICRTALHRGIPAIYTVVLARLTPQRTTPILDCISWAMSRMTP
ncbi:MAG: hypothetical protein IPH83_20620 [Gammaproteobacteria bacterium]|nr:hypothetical protein [Gammaproteobacteria bacterium]